jgi:hypothetical protein
MSDDETLDNQNVNHIHMSSASFTNDTTSSTTTPTFISVQTQTISSDTVDSSTQTIPDYIISTETHTSKPATNIDDFVTDEDIIKYLMKRQRREQQ